MRPKKTAVDKFNALNGFRVKKDVLKEIKAEAVNQLQQHVVDAINYILNEKKSFWGRYSVDIDKPLEWVLTGSALGCPDTPEGESCRCGGNEGKADGLGAPRHGGLAKEALTECGRLKPGFQFLKGGEIVKKEKPKKNKGSKLLIEQMKPVSGLTDNEIHQIVSEWSSKNQWPSEISGYIGAVKRELNKRNKNKKKAEKKPDLKTSKNDKKLQKYREELDVLLELTGKEKASIESLREELKNSKSDKWREINQKIWDKKKLIELKQGRIDSLSNIIMALLNGGTVRDITDKKGKPHREIPDFTEIPSRKIEFTDDSSILKEQAPPYIPLLNIKELERRGFVFDAIRIDRDAYLTATSRHDEKGAEYVILTLDQLVLTSDFYLKTLKAMYKKEAKAINERKERNWSELPEEKRKRFYQQPNQKALYRSLPAKIKKKVSLEQWNDMDWKEKESVHKFYKRVGVKRLKSKLDSKSMWVSMHDMYERFIDPKATKPKPRTANAEVFAYWKKFREMLDFKILDLEVQRGDYSDARKKGMETAFGDKNTDDTLKHEYGVLVKRQNGDRINPAEISDIEKALETITDRWFGGFNVILKSWTDNFGLKVSHTGNTLVYARKAVGVYVPSYRAVASSKKFGQIDFACTLAHELAHFFDHQMGDLKGRRYMSDNYESEAGKVAMVFRENMNGYGNIKSNYTNSTKECFARALEQYFAMEQFGNKVLVNYSEMEGPVSEMDYSNAPNHVNREVFYKKVVPLIEKFIDKVQESSPRPKKGLGSPAMELFNRDNMMYQIENDLNEGLSGTFPECSLGMVPKKKIVYELVDTIKPRLPKMESFPSEMEKAMDNIQRISEERRPPSITSFHVEQKSVETKKPVAIVSKTETGTQKTKKHALVSKMSDLDKGPVENFRTSGDMGRFLGDIEKKPEESLVCTLDAPQGGGKTRLFFQIIKMFIDNGYANNILFISLEEHPRSGVFTKKRDMYLPKEYHDMVEVVGKLPNPSETLKELIPHYDIVLIDSWGKVADLDKDLDLDRDIRTRYDGKLFFVIFQRTADGKMRGGSRAQFDADMVMKVEKDVTDYRNNYAYWDKNRYSIEPGLKYNIFSQMLMDDLPQEQEADKSTDDNKVELV